MKIALVSPYDFSYPGGVVRHIISLENHFTRMGHEVTIIAPASAPVTLYGDRFIAIGKPRPIPASGSIARIAISLNLTKKVKAALAKEQFDIVHLHEPLCPTLCTTVLRHSKSTTIGTFHAAESRPSYRWTKAFLMNGLYKKWFKKLDGRIAVSRPARDFINKHFPATYEIIPNGVELAHFSPKTPPLEEFQDGKINLLFLGRSEKRKGLEYMIKAFQLIKPDHPECRLIVVSPKTRARRKYEKQVEAARLQDVVFVDGRAVNDLQKPRYYSSAHIFCSPATGRESFGLVLLEAMAAGKPVVASNIPGYASVLTHDSEGILVPPKQEVPLAQALSRLISDANLRSIMGEKGRIKAAGFGWAEIAQRVMDFYQQVVEARARKAQASQENKKTTSSASKASGM